MPESPDDSSAKSADDSPVETHADGTTEFRELREEEIVTLHEFVDYAFSPEEGPQEYDPEDLPERAGRGFGVVADGDLVSVCVHYDFEARLRGSWVPLAGLAAVATPPEHRRQGHVARMVEGSLARWRGEYPLAALWPFDRQFYRRFGWATANKTVTYTCPPEALGATRARAGGAFRRLDPDDWRELRGAHEAHATDRNLTLRRDENWWRERVFTSFGDERYVYAWTGTDVGGDVRGYVVYDFEKTGEGMDARELTVHDLAFADEAAHLNLLRFLADHDSQVESVRFTREADAALLDRVPDPSDVDAEVSAGPMVRIVDVPHALEAVPYPDDAAADLTLRVTDDTAPWNDDTFRLQVGDGAGACVRTDDPPSDPDAAVDVGTLSQLVVGYHGVADARRVGALDVADEAVAETLGALFPEETVFLRTFF